MRGAISSTPALGTGYRVIVPGAEMEMLLLAGEPGGSVGVDLESGAFVRATHPPPAEPLAAYDVVAATIAGAPEPPDAARPEAVELADAPERVGQIPARRAERLLAPLHHPPQLPLLGMGANAVPYWTLSGDRPSLSLVELRNEPRVRWGPFGPECRFSWQGSVHDLPLIDRPLIAALQAHGLSRPSRADLLRILGYRARRLLVMLTPPHNGYCHKAVAALLPVGR
jgi:hypothetical protein